MSSALGDEREAELGSFTAVVEDEEIEKDLKKDSSVGRKKDTCCCIFKLTSG